MCSVFFWSDRKQSDLWIKNCSELHLLSPITWGESRLWVHFEGWKGKRNPWCLCGLGAAGQWQVLVWLHHEVPVSSSGSSLGGRVWEQDRPVVVHLMNIFHVQQFWLWEFLHQVFLLCAALSSWCAVTWMVVSCSRDFSSLPARCSGEPQHSTGWDD